MAMLGSDERRGSGPYWTLWVLALLASACGSESTPADRGDDTEEEMSPAEGDEDDESGKEDDKEDGAIDAGTAGKKDAALDAKTTLPSTMKDARVVVTSDSGSDDTVELADSGKSAPDAATLPK